MLHIALQNPCFCNAICRISHRKTIVIRMQKTIFGEPNVAFLVGLSMVLAS